MISSMNLSWRLTTPTNGSRALGGASDDPAGQSTALQGGDRRTRFLAADYLAEHRSALRGGARQGTGREVIVHLVIPIAHNKVHAMLVFPHSPISFHLGTESRTDDLAHGI